MKSFTKDDSAEEIRNTVDMGHITLFSLILVERLKFKRAVETKGKVVSGMQEYASNSNTNWMDSMQISSLLDKLNG